MVFTFAALLVLSNAARLGVSVVCVGSDGHVDVEALICGCCSAPASAAGNVHPDLAAADPSCTGCVDVQMTVPYVETRTPTLSARHINTAGRIVGPGCAGGCRTGPVVSGNPMDQHWRSLAPLSTVVLLT